MGLDEYIGQIRIKDYFRKAKIKQIFHHCYIIEGPAGSGKKQLVRFLSKLINCKESQDDFCDSCPTCRKLNRGVYTDFIVLEPSEGKKNIPIKLIREIQPILHYQTIEGGTRIIIINRVESLLIEAQNALLKSLEEPPAGNIFFLLTENRSIFLPTILSRGELLRMTPLLPNEITKILKRDFPDKSDKEILSLVEISGGNPGFAAQLVKDPLLKEIQLLTQNVFSGSAKSIFRLSALFKRKDLNTTHYFESFIRFIRLEIFNRRKNGKLLAYYTNVDRNARLLNEFNLNPALTVEHILLGIIQIINRKTL